MKRPKLLISGYYGLQNAGDELILKAMLTHLRALNPDLEITVLSAQPRVTARNYSVRSVHRLNPFSIFREMIFTDLFISGGGGLLQDKSGDWSPFYYLGLTRLAKFLGKKTMLYGQGLGPLQRGYNQRLVAGWIKKMDLVSVREEQSRIFLQQLGLNGTRIVVTADPVLGLELSWPVTEKSDRQKLNLGIVLRSWPDNPGGLEKLTGILARVSQELSARLIFIPFGLSEDLPLSRRLTEQLQRVYSVVPEQMEIFVWEKPEELVSRFKTLDFCLSMRLHGLILGLLAGLPVLGLARDPKIANFLEIFGQKPWDLRGENSWLELKQSIFQKKGRPPVLAELKDKAKQNAVLCLELLNNG